VEKKAQDEKKIREFKLVLPEKNFWKAFEIFNSQEEE
jgi:hypothetical protein